MRHLFLPLFLAFLALPVLGDDTDQADKKDAPPGQKAEQPENAVEVGKKPQPSQKSKKVLGMEFREPDWDQLDVPVHYPESVASASAVDGDKEKYPCGRFDPDCRKKLLRLLTGVHFGDTEVSAGIQFSNTSQSRKEQNNDDTEAPLRAKTTGFSIDAVGGDFRALTFEAVYFPDEGGTRVRVMLADADVLFFCKDEETGKIKPPFVAFFNACTPEAIFALGGKLGEFQWDEFTNRISVRWAEINAVFNFLANGNGIDYLSKRLVAFAGFSAETTWPGNAPLATDGGPISVARGNLGIMGFIRSDDNKWEVRGRLNYRPNLGNRHDYGLEASVEIGRHFLVGENSVATVGFNMGAVHWSMPTRSIGPFASDREKNNFYLGLFFRMRF